MQGVQLSALDTPIDVTVRIGERGDAFVTFKGTGLTNRYDSLVLQHDDVDVLMASLRSAVWLLAAEKGRKTVAA